MLVGVKWVCVALLIGEWALDKYIFRMEFLLLKNSIY